ncbi:MAG: response regulator [Archangiaceae bacterium]|nr:response regulator [Archangiaceae bacterium]
MAASAALLRHIDRLLPRGLATHELFQARFVAIVGFIAVMTGLWTGTALLFLPHPTAWVTLLYGAFATAALVAFERGVISARTLFWGLEVLTAMLFSGTRVFESELDWPLVTWLSVLPLLAVLMGGWRSGLAGMGIAVVTGASFVVIEYAGFDVSTPVPTFVSIVRGVSLIIAFFAIALAFDQLRRDVLNQVEEASRARSLVLANMSHELRTPMNGVIGITDLLLATELSPDTRKSLELIKRSGSQMVTLVNDILDLTRLESGRVGLELLATDLRAVMHDLVGLMKPVADQKGIALTTEVQPSVPAWALTDPTRLLQVLTNLVSNGVKFTERGGVSLVASWRDGTLRIDVKDTGIGMPLDVQRRLFQPFEQADASYTRRFGGSGLGLTISRHLVSLLEGSIELSSVPGGGSTFVVKVPFTACAAVASVADAERAPHHDRSPHVLVVEDNDINLHVALAMLARTGCTAVAARDGVEALAALEKEKFDLVLMDCHMPNKDGFTATRELRARQGTSAHTWVVAVTASALTDDLRQCREAGMDDVVTKPLTLIALQQALARAIV